MGKLEYNSSFPSHWFCQRNKNTMRKEQFGQRLKSLREATGKTQDEVAKCVDLTFSAVSKWEAGESFPKADTLIALARCFHIKPESFFSDEPPVPAPDETQEYGEYNGFKWVIDTTTYPSDRGIWLSRMREYSGLFIDAIKGNLPHKDESKSAIRLRAALEARFIRLLSIPRAYDREVELASRYGLAEGQVFVADIDMPVISPVVALIGAEIVGWLAALPLPKGKKDIFPYDDTTHIGIAHGSTLQRFVSHIRPSGYVYSDKEFIALTAVKHQTQTPVEQTANVLTGTLGNKFPAGKAWHMPYLPSDRRASALQYSSLSFPSETDEHTIAEIIFKLKRKRFNVYLSGSSFSFNNPVGAVRNAPVYSHYYDKIKRLHLEDRFCGEISGSALDENGNLLCDNDYVCAITPDVYKEMVKAGSYVWLIGAGIERASSFATAMKSKIANGIVVTRDLAEALNK